MKKTMKRTIITLCLAVMLIFGAALAGCTPKVNENTDFGKNDEIIVGNTAATTGAFAGVGLPFNIAIEAVLAKYNAEKAADRKPVKFVHYDDTFVADKGLEFTTKLVEDDKIFALVGHFGTGTVGATVNYIKEKKVPMVYAATGTDVLFNAEAKDGARYLLPVQPIFTTEGAIMLARAVAPAGELVSGFWSGLGLGLTKIGVVYTNDDAGTGMKGQIDKQLALIKAKGGAYANVTVTAQQIAATASEANSAIDALKTAGVECVIIAANQAPATVVAKSMTSQNIDVPAITSYVNATASWAAGLGDGFFNGSKRVVYTNAWVDATANVPGTADEMAEFVKVMTDYANLTGTVYQITDNTNAATYLLNNAYAMAGYIAGYTFIEGLNRTLKDGGTLTRANFIDAMEKTPIKIPMSPGTIDYANGSRVGLTNLSFFAFNTSAGGFDFSTYKTFSDIAAIMAALV